jgi:hypothetical protein
MNRHMTWLALPRYGQHLDVVVGVSVNRVRAQLARQRRGAGAGCHASRVFKRVHGVQREPLRLARRSGRRLISFQRSMASNHVAEGMGGVQSAECERAYEVSTTS